MISISVLTPAVLVIALLTFALAVAQLRSAYPKTTPACPLKSIRCCHKPNVHSAVIRVVCPTPRRLPKVQLLTCVHQAVRSWSCNCVT